MNNKNETKQTDTNSDERQIGANYSSAYGNQVSKEPLDGGPLNRIEAADALVEPQPEGIAQRVRGSANPDREFRSDEFDVQVGQDNKPNNQIQFTKPEART